MEFGKRSTKRLGEPFPLQMKTVLLILLISFNGALSTKIMCAAGTFYNQGAIIAVNKIESKSGCKVALHSEAPCSMASIFLSGVAGAAAGQGCVYFSSTHIECVCSGDLCNQDPETIYKLLTEKDWSNYPSGQALVQCGLQVLQEAYGIPMSQSTTTTIITAFPAPADPSDGEDDNSDDYDQNTSSAQSGSNNGSEEESCNNENMVSTGGLYAVIGVGIVIILILILAIPGIIVIRKGKMTKLDAQMGAMVGNKDILRKDIKVIKDRMMRTREKLSKQQSDSQSQSQSKQSISVSIG